MSQTEAEAAPWRRTPRELQDSLTRWAQHLHGTKSRLENFWAPSSGMQNDTMLFSLGGERLVARMAPPPGMPFPTFPSFDLERQRRVMELVAKRTEAPVPEVVHLETSEEWLGVPFLVMRAMEGQPAPDNPPYQADPSGWFLHGSREDWNRFERSTLDVIARVHILADGDETAFLRPTTEGASPLARYLAEQRSYYEWAHDGGTIPVLDRAFEVLASTMPGPERTVLVWGDARPANVLYRDFEAAAVLDWELATVGPPELDVAWVTFFQKFFAHLGAMWGLPSVPDLFDPAETVATYEDFSGAHLDDLRWYEAFSGLRVAIMMSRIQRRTALQKGGSWPDDPDDSFMFKGLLAELLDRL